MLSLWTKGQGGPVLATMPLVLSFVTSHRNFLCSSLLDKASRLTIRRVIVSLASDVLQYLSTQPIYKSTNLETAMLCTDFLHHGIWHSGGLSWTAHVCLVSSCLVLQQMKTAFLSLPLCQKFKTFNTLTCLPLVSCLVLSCFTSNKSCLPLPLSLFVSLSNVQTCKIHFVWMEVGWLGPFRKNIKRIMTQL